MYTYAYETTRTIWSGRPPRTFDQVMRLNLQREKWKKDNKILHTWKLPVKPVLSCDRRPFKTKYMYNCAVHAIPGHGNTEMVFPPDMELLRNEKLSLDKGI